MWFSFCELTQVLVFGDVGVYSGASRKAKANPYLADTSSKHSQVLGPKGSILLCSVVLEEVALMVAHAARGHCRTAGPGLKMLPAASTPKLTMCVLPALQLLAASPQGLSGDNPMPGANQGVKKLLQPTALGEA